MEVKLLSHTPNALDLLLRTKNTRLGSDNDPATWSAERKAEHLSYMLDTIKSSWEFVDYTFEISGVSRAFTHQLVRTRAGHYAQESQRTVDVRAQAVLRPEAALAEAGAIGVWEEAERCMMGAYAQMIDAGVPVQDARGILPTNITTSITAKFDLRTLSAMAAVRLCVRTQGEYQDVFRAMRAAVLDVHPWAAPFIEVQCVATGTCAFPRYGRAQCPFWDPRMDLTQLKEDTRRKFWESGIRHVARPMAKDGKTM